MENENCSPLVCFIELEGEMENSQNNTPNQSREQEESLHSLSKDRGSAGDDSFQLTKSKSKRQMTVVHPECALTLKVTQSKIGKKDSFRRSHPVLASRILKRIISVDETYIRHWLELIHLSASKAAKFSNPLESLPSMGSSLGSAKIITEDTTNLSALTLDCPLSAGSESLAVSPPRRWIVGSITGSKSMVNILNSPLFRQFGASDRSPNHRVLNDAEGSICYDFMNSPGNLYTYLSPMLAKQSHLEGFQKSRPEAGHERFASRSSVNSSSTDQTSSSGSSPISQGMIQCTWKDGTPHLVFSIDNQKEIYIAKSSKIKVAEDNSLDCKYLFYAGKSCHMEHEIPDKESHLVGKMNVSTSFSLCSCNSKIKETEFILFGGIDNSRGETHFSPKKNRRFSKKVAEVFRTGHPTKQRSISRFSGSAILEDSTWDPYQDTFNDHESQYTANLLDDNLPPNYELASMILKHHLPERRQEEVGGWGLKFLRKAGAKQALDSSKPLGNLKCCIRGDTDCSTSMNVIVPAGLHGGPRTRNGGPSTLTERWKSGGQCDCGGWDLGCPLTVLTTSSDKGKILPQEDTRGKCKSFDIFIQGSGHCVPALRMTNIHEDLYVIHFQSILSTLQSFAIAVAHIHSRSHAIQS